MPSKSPDQAKLMRAVAHGWHPSDFKGPSVAVAREFMHADQAAHKFAGGGLQRFAGGDSVPDLSEGDYGQDPHPWNLTSGWREVPGMVGRTLAGYGAGMAGIPRQLEDLYDALPGTSRLVGPPHKYFPSTAELLGHEPTALEQPGVNVGEWGIGAGPLLHAAGEAPGMLAQATENLGRAGTPMAQLGALNPRLPGAQAPSRFFGLQHDVPLANVSGEAAAGALKGPENQKLGDLLKQLTAQPNVRTGALKAVSEHAKQVLGGDPGAVVSKGALAQALQQPRALTRVRTRQDLLPEKWQQKFEMGEREAGEGEFEPDEEWVRDRANEILNDHFYESGEAYDHGDVMRDVFDEAQRYAADPERMNTSGGLYYTTRDHHEQGGLLRQFMEEEGVPLRDDATSLQATLFGGAPMHQLDVRRKVARPSYEDQRADPEQYLRDNTAYKQLFTDQAVAHGHMINAMTQGEHETAAQFGHQLGYDVHSPEFSDLSHGLEDAGSLKDYADNHGHFDGREHDYADTRAFERTRDSHEESNREGYEEQNYGDAYARAEEEAREDGHGEYTGGEGAMGGVEPYRYGSTQRLVKQDDPDLYTQQNVFSFAPTGASLTRRGRNMGSLAYRPDMDVSAAQKAADKLQAKITAGTADHEDKQWHQALTAIAQSQPGSPIMASHFPQFTPANLRSNYLGHFRGSMLPSGSYNPFLLEELQSDLGQTFSRMGLSKQAPAQMQDWVGQMGRAAFQHAVESGATAFHVPTAASIEKLRGSKDYGWLYDKALPNDVLEPLAKHFNVPIEQGTTNEINTYNTGARPIETRYLPITDEMRDSIMNNGVPYAQGGPVRMPNIRTAATAPTVNDPVIAHLMRHTNAPAKAAKVYPMRYAQGGAAEPSDEAIQQFFQSVLDAEQQAAQHG